MSYVTGVSCFPPLTVGHMLCFSFLLLVFFLRQHLSQIIYLLTKSEFSLTYSVKVTIIASLVLMEFSQIILQILINVKFLLLCI